MYIYQRTQLGILLIALLSLIEIINIIVFILLRNEPESISLFVFIASQAFVSLIFLLFFKLSVKVTEENILLHFGIGLIKRTIPLNSILDVKQVRNQRLMGFGIRYYGDGWMWNIAGLDAIELHYKDGSQFRIGTDEPERLKEIIKAKIT